MPALTGRQLTAERMDDPAVDPAELEAALRFLGTVNRRLAGISSTLAPLTRWAVDWPPEQVVRILDVGCGGGDIPIAIADWAVRQGRRVQVTGVDFHERTVETARRWVGGRPEIEIVRGDARALLETFEPGAFDVAHASLFLHHLPDVEVMTVLRIMQRLAVRGLIWNDLVRSPLAAVGIRLATIGCGPMVRHDAIVSERAGFTRREAFDLARRVGLPGLHWRRHLVYRFTLTSRWG